MTLPSPLSFLREVIEDAQRRVAGGEAVYPTDELERRKTAEWRARGVPGGTVQAALSWAKRITRGYADKFPPEVRDQRYAELLPAFLDDAERRYIRAVLRSMGLEAQG